MTQKRNRTYTALKRLMAALLAGLAALTAAGCGNAADAAAQNQSAPDTAVQSEPAAAPDAAVRGEAAPSVRITELLAKNRSVLMDETGAFPDWIELENVSAGEVDLSGFTIADGEDEDGWRFPAIKLAPGERLLIYADGTKNSAVASGAQGGAKAAVHVDFSLSEGESVCLFDARGALVDKAECTSAEADAVLSLNADGEWGVTLYPTPGYENSAAGYDAWQESVTPAPPLVISEVVTANFSVLEQSALGCCDYVEIKNVSAAPVELSEYCLSDDDDELSMWQFPSAELAPGESAIVLCEKGEGEPDEGFFKAGFELNSESEQLYLSRGGKVVDYAFLRGIPYGGSFGRMDGENGWFYFAAPQPYSAKRGGCRRVSAAPETTSADGIFDGVTSMEISLAAPGQIYYTIDGSLPSAESEEYKSPISIDSTCVIRAIAVEDGALPSSALTLSYILNEGHGLPVVSLVSDDPAAFERMYVGKKKDMELSGALSLYAPEGGFTINCGIDMHGETSLEQTKKNMGLRFRGAYGAASLDYDIYGGGITSFEGLILRAGQDQNDAVIRNELLENLAQQFSDKIFAQRNRYCVLYVNGKYYGLYTLTEKTDTRRYAAERGVSEESVTVIKAPALFDDEYYSEVIRFAQENDLTDPEKYEEFCARVDIDSLIDWLIVEGYSANADISTANLRYARSTEDGGRWSFMLFDLDSVLTHPLMAYGNVLKPTATQNAVFVNQLVKNSDFREKFLNRAAEALNGVFSNENVSAEIDRLAAEVAPEIARDFALRDRVYTQWEYSLDMLRDNIVERDWRANCIMRLMEYLPMTAEEAALYFE